MRDLQYLWCDIRKPVFIAPSINFYTERLPVAEARSKAYWNHNGAAFMELPFFSTCLPQIGPVRIIIQPMANYYPNN